MTMLHLSDSFFPASRHRSAGPASTALSRLAHLLAWPLRVVRARRDLALLSGLSEYELRDIGLSGQDLRNATALPLDADPTTFLARAAKASKTAAALPSHRR